MCEHVVVEYGLPFGHGGPYAAGDVGRAWETLGSADRTVRAKLRDLKDHKSVLANLRRAAEAMHAPCRS
jgi:hypothetical protein